MTIPCEDSTGFRHSLLMSGAETLDGKTYITRHRELCERLERDAVVFGETQDGQMRLYVERLRPGAVRCSIRAIRNTPPKSSADAAVFRMSHDGQRWSGNLDTCCMIERYPVEMVRWDIQLRGMTFQPGEFPF